MVMLTSPPRLGTALGHPLVSGMIVSKPGRQLMSRFPTKYPRDIHIGMISGIVSESMMIRPLQRQLHLNKRSDRTHTPHLNLIIPPGGLIVI